MSGEQGLRAAQLFKMEGQLSNVSVTKGPMSR